ncbi:alpha/beta hydrolase [Pelomicrobium sp.]|uniref:alpha/beta hydrolase n=1 Tax=Pelomicrobium sp. TaxID=2815319 RepID=UPI002FDD6BC2
MTSATEAPLLASIEIETAPQPRFAVIWMHGLGADGHDFVPIVHELGLPAAPGVRFIFPHAPLRPVTINGGYVMRAWYDVLSPGFTQREDASGIRASQQAIDALIAREASRGIDPAHIVLGGFSQGGAMALHTGLRHGLRLGGIVALSTYLPLAESLPVEASPANARVPIFMAHGSHDPLIPLSLAVGSRERLVAMGYSVEWRVYPMQHSVCMEEIADIGAWLRRRMGTD